MKTAKPSVFTIDLECPECGELVANSGEDGQLSFSVHEALPAELKCNACGAKCKAPKRVLGRALVIDRIGGGAK